MATTRAATRVTDRLLAVGALLGLVALLSAALGAALGVRPLFFRSGSMAPTIDTGSLALARSVPASDLRVGDVVSVVAASGSRVTHRVVRVDRVVGPSQVALTLRGDANRAPDSEQYVVGSAYRVFWHVPWAGYLAGTLLSPVGLAAGGLLVALVLAGGRPKPASRRKGRHKARSRRRDRTRKIVVTTAATAAALSGSVGPASAAPWTDDVPISAGTFSAYLVPKPSINSCTVTGGALAQKTASIVWNDVSSPDALDYSATILETGTAMTVHDNGTTRQTQFSAGLLSTILNQTYNIRITARLPAPNGAWTSVTANQPVTITLLGLGMTCGTPS